MGWYYELGAMLLVANLVPALAWFASMFSPQVKTKYSYRNIFWFFQTIVEVYVFVIPVIFLHA